MIFNSFFFILIFLPLTVSGWFLLNRKSMILSEWFLIGMSLWFYGSFSPWYLAVLAVSVALNYGFGRLVQGKKGLLAAGILLNLALLSWFKYVTPELGAPEHAGTMVRSLLAIGLPVGFSFYTFSQISYLIDSFRGEVKNDGFRRYLLYITYFPKIVEGPITCYEEVISQLRNPANRVFSAEQLSHGILLFTFGLGKKLLIADVLAGPAVFGIQSAYYLDTLSVLLTMTCYALQLYFDFSGFCDMAMGISWMLNIHLPLNFDAPFQAESFPEFWKRWHMTLTRFFTKYVYIPLGGSRRGTLRTCLNVLAVFVLSGFWHGLGWNYLIWGLLSGVLVVAGNLLRKRAQNRRKEQKAGSKAVGNTVRTGLGRELRSGRSEEPVPADVAGVAVPHGGKAGGTGILASEQGGRGDAAFCEKSDSVCGASARACRIYGFASWEKNGRKACGVHAAESQKCRACRNSSDLVPVFHVRSLHVPVF